MNQTTLTKKNAQVLRSPAALYGLIGDGRLARHLAHYFSLLQIPIRRWSRKQANDSSENWSKALSECPILLLAVSDHSIEPLATEIRKTAGFEDRILIHFSGCLSTDLAHGFHPLMSFGAGFYPLETYERIPFVADSKAPPFKKLFPRLENPSVKIAEDKKALYHAWCVMSGNFTAFLWTRMFESFSKDLGLDPRLAAPYLKELASRLLESPETARNTWTGPIVRGDTATIGQNLAALSDDPYRAVYEAFLKANGELK